MEKQISIFLGHTSTLIKININSRQLINVIKNFLYQLNDYTFDRKLRKYVKDKNYYIAGSSGSKDFQDLIYIPISYTNLLKDTLIQEHISFDIDVVKDIETKKSNILPSPDWHIKDEQQDAIKFLTTYHKTMRCLALSTGVGKTFCSIRASLIIGDVVLIITSGLVQQWTKALIEQTSLEEEDIYLIRGNVSILELMTQTTKPKCIVASLETMRNFAQRKTEYEDFQYSIHQMCDHLGIGIKIVDECHDNFHGITCIDLMVNIKINIYLSATYIRNNASTHKIFDMIFPPESRFGEGDYEQHVDTKIYKYSSFVPTKFVNKGGSYSHYNYEEYLLKHENGVKWFCIHLLKPVIEERYMSIRKPGQRMLIFLGKIESIYKVTNFLKTMYPTLDIRSFTAKDKEDNLNADIIISTIDKSGTGRDIPNLVSILLTVSIKAKGLLKQVFGRGRKLKDGSQVYFSDLTNIDNADHARHIGHRVANYRQWAKTLSDQRLY